MKPRRSLVQLEMGRPSMEIQKQVKRYLAQPSPPPAKVAVRVHEAQADPPQVDHNSVAKANKFRSVHDVVLTLLSNGDFADHEHESQVDRVHAHGKGGIRTQIVTTIINKWGLYCTPPFWTTFAKK